jgi:hypothetical protein
MFQCNLSLIMLNRGNVLDLLLECILSNKSTIKDKSNLRDRSVQISLPDSTAHCEHEPHIRWGI